MKKLLALLALSVFSGFFSRVIGLTTGQSFILAVFTFSIFGTLFFWDLRLTFVFVGSGMLFLIHGVDVDHFIKFASLDVIIFLVGMMIIVGMMRETGVFHWLVGASFRMKNLTARKLFISLLFLSALFSGLMGEVASIMVMVAIILDLSKSLKIRPAPFVIASVLATNIGSASTLLGNPIGVLIALRAGLSFEDFITHALPVSLVALAATILVLCFWYRSYLKEISAAVDKYKYNQPHVSIKSMNRQEKVSIALFVVTISAIVFHRRLELFFGLEDNNLLIMLPIIFAGIVLAYRRKKAHYYIEHEVEWTSLLFFMFLFAQAGVLQTSGIAQALAEKILTNIGNKPALLSGGILFSSGMLSSVLDNTIVVASSIPVIKSLSVLHMNPGPLWWAILFGACFGGNITAIGSTANIVALGLLEKERGIKINFFEWLKIGLVIGFLTMGVSFIYLLFLQG